MIRVVFFLLFFSLPSLSLASIVVQEVKTDIGITAFLVENHTNPIVSVKLSFATGSAYDGAGKQGLSLLYSQLLDKGAGEFDAQEFQTELYNNSIRLGFHAYTEEFEASLKTLKSNYKKGFDLLALSLSEPRLPKADIVTLKKQIISDIKIKQEQPKNEIFSYFKKEVFGNHPYGYGELDVLRDISSITKPDLANYKKRFAKDNILIGVSGAITAKELKKVIEETLSFLPASSIQPALPEPEFLFHKSTVVIHRDSQQSAIMFGLPWVERKSKEFFTGYLLNYILGGSGLDSVLMQELREKQGLTYSISTFVSEYRKLSLLFGFATTSSDKASQLIANTKKVLGDFIITQAQLDKAKNYLIGAFPLTFTSTMATADLLVTMQRYELGLDYLSIRNDYIQSVSLDDIILFKKQYLDKAEIDFIKIGENK